MRKPFPYAASALMLALVLVVSACSKSLTLQEYFTKIGGIQKQYEDKSTALQDTAQSSTATDDASILGDIKSFMSGTVDLTAKAKADLEALKPPSEAKAAHEAFVRAFGDLLTAITKAQEVTDKATTVDEAVSALQDEALASAGDALDKACSTLSTIAEDNEVTTTLHCGDQDKAAEAGLRNSLAAAKTIFTDTDSYSGISVEAMVTVEPSLNYVDSGTLSTGPSEISIYTDGSMVYAAAALSDSGTCYYIKDDASVGTTFGTGSKDACTGQSAVDSATASSW